MIKIRKANESDALEIKEVFHKTWLATYPNELIGITSDDIDEIYKDAYSEEKLASLREKISNIPESSKFFVAENDGKVIGVCRIYLKDDFNQLQAIYTSRISR